ncbi:hypothetical protein [Streptomyces sp. CC219B]|uniref:hypothetical protein n=1 Tax=Streptomyces sp. CC219B TaxID=3044574 RepID=UPI0024A819F6|nr:hypothetical protein [Streptomyces sp. CC219B]
MNGEGEGVRARLDAQYAAYGEALRGLGLPVHDMPGREDVEALLAPGVRQWLEERADAGHRDDLVMAPSVRHLGGWRAFRELLATTHPAVVVDTVPRNSYRYPFDPPERHLTVWQRLADRLHAARGLPAVHAAAVEAERVRHVVQHDDGQQADWLVGLVLDDSDEPEPEGRGLKYTRRYLAEQRERVREEDETVHRPEGRHIGSITVPQYLAWQAMRRLVGLPPADGRSTEPFVGNPAETLTIQWKTRFPCYLPGRYQPPSPDPNTANATISYGIVGYCLPDGSVTVRPNERSDGFNRHEGVRRVLRLN